MKYDESEFFSGLLGQVEQGWKNREQQKAVNKFQAMICN